ncbi:GGDEF domain-containing protein [Anaeromicrobium sediminis]|uniref:GGDEF domain-containing protein n=1 Tax=Anaeromicrobium sediminis TaxID=1478221 RepID=A0A267MKK1_9FIRM|nr:GGDEF domain-containing protein [Anaeromicrobium sediminis]PAB59932.1 hypothetical protein CCE28_08235 [Anaeromicrobium sediminis]
MKNDMFFFYEGFHPMFIIDYNSFNVVNINEKAKNLCNMDLSKVNRIEDFIPYVNIHIKDKIKIDYILRNKYIFHSWFDVYLKKINLENKDYIWIQLIDVSRYKTKEEEAKYIAYHDTVTNLPNRRYMDDYLKVIFNSAMRENKNIGLMFIDLDNFKSINDTYGHMAGDEALKTVSKHIKGALRKSDLIARFGGDEFLVILEDMPKIEIANSVAERIIEELQTPIIVKEKKIKITCSIGIGMFPEHGNDMESIINYADKAMYEAKRLGKNTYKKNY